MWLIRNCFTDTCYPAPNVAPIRESYIGHLTSDTLGHLWLHETNRSALLPPAPKPSFSPLQLPRLLCLPLNPCKKKTPVMVPFISRLWKNPLCHFSPCCSLLVSLRLGKPARHWPGNTNSIHRRAILIKTSDSQICNVLKYVHLYIPCSSEIYIGNARMVLHLRVYHSHLIYSLNERNYKCIWMKKKVEVPCLVISTSPSSKKTKKKIKGTLS